MGEIWKVEIMASISMLIFFTNQCYIDSRDIAILPNSTPTRQLDVNIASSPVMLPPTPDVYRNHPRSPVKQTPTKESGSVKGEVTLGDFGLKMGGSSEHGLLDKSIENIMSSPTKNSSPAQGKFRSWLDRFYRLLIFL